MEGRPVGSGPKYMIRVTLFSTLKRVQFSHVRVFSDSRNVQKSVTRIMYLEPLPFAHVLSVLQKLTILHILSVNLFISLFIRPKHAPI